MPLKREFIAEFESKGARKLIDDVKAMQASFDDLGEGMKALEAGQKVFSFEGQDEIPGLEAMTEKLREAQQSLKAIQIHIKKDGLGAEEVRALSLASEDLSDRIGEMWSSFADSKFANKKEWRGIADEIFRMQNGIEGIKDAKSQLDKVQQGMESLLGSGDQIKSAFKGIGKESPLRTFVGSRKALRGFGQQAMTLGKSMSKMKGIQGVVGKGLLKIGGAATGAAAGFLAAGAAAAGAVVLFLKIEDAIAKFSKQLVAAHGAMDIAMLSTGRFSKALDPSALNEGLITTRRSLRIFHGTVMRGSMGIEEATKGYEAFAKAGVRAEDLYKTEDGLIGSMEGAATAGLLLGVGFERGADLMGQFMINTGNTVEGLRESFTRVSRSAQQSGMSTAQFTSTLLTMMGPMGVLDSRVESAAKQLALFTDSLGAARGKDVIADLRKAMGTGIADVDRHLRMIAGGKGGMVGLSIAPVH